MINWRTIAEKYPKAYSRIQNCTYINSQTLAPMYPSDSWGTTFDKETWGEQGIQFNLSDLYDFFDKQGIHAEALHSRGSIVGPFWFWNILEGDGTFNDMKSYSSRVSAEIAAFTKAFEILENRLNR